MEHLSNQEEEDLFDIKKLTIDPEISKISEAVKMKLQFSVRRAIENPVYWKVNYIIDSTGKRVIIELVQTEKYEYKEVGKVYEVELKTPQIDVEKVPRKTLMNVGLLAIKAYSTGNEETEELSLNMVVHVSKDKTDESMLLKTILNPID